MQHAKQALGSKVNDKVNTPKKLYEALNDHFHFDFDPCPADPKFDGLTVPWGKSNYVNPPYSQISVWLAKANKEYNEHGNSSVFLIPWRGSNVYWWSYVWSSVSSIWIPKNRIKFEGYKTAAPLQCAILIFKKDYVAPAKFLSGGGYQFVTMNVLPGSVPEMETKKKKKS
jgi:DNA N-6-adenine-methyltransferase Dam